MLGVRLCFGVIPLGFGVGFKVQVLDYRLYRAWKEYTPTSVTSVFVRWSETLGIRACGAKALFSWHRRCIFLPTPSSHWSFRT